MRTLGFFTLATLVTLTTILPACQSSMSSAAPQETEGFCRTLRGTVVVRTNTVSSDVSSVKVRGILSPGASPDDVEEAHACITAPTGGRYDVRWGPPSGVMKIGGVEYAKVGFEVDNIFFMPGGMIDASAVVKGIVYAYNGPADTNDFTTPHDSGDIRPFEGNIILREKK